MPNVESNVISTNLISDKNILGLALGGGNNTFLNPALGDSLSKLKPKLIRLEAVTADYRDIYNPENKQWNFSKLDKEVDGMYIFHPFVLGDIFYVPKFLSSCPNSEYYAFCKPNNYDAWSFYVETIVNHLYKKYGINTWEIGNEPSGRYFFRGNMQEFYDFYINTAQAVKKVNPNMKVGGFGDNIFYIENYNKFIKSILAINPQLLDFISIHWYAEWNKKYSPSDIYVLVSALQNTIEKYYHRPLPVYLTEWGLMASTSPPNGVEQVVSYYISSLYYLEVSAVSKAFYFRVEKLGNIEAQLISPEGSLTQLGKIYKDINNSNYIHYYNFGAIYIISLQKFMYITNYSNVSQKITIDVCKKRGFSSFNNVDDRGSIFNIEDKKWLELKPYTTLKCF